jgi:phosphopantetheine adenylyltransferase
MKKNLSEKMMTSKQQVTQMNHYWKDLHHALTSDAEKKKSMDRRFGIKDIKVDRRGNLISFNKYKRGQSEDIDENKINSFGQFLEAKQKTVVFSFGRFNPPTIGHQKLLQKVIQTAKKEGGHSKLFVSYSQDPKRNPLIASKKIAHIKKMFPKEARQLDIKDNSSIKTAIDVAVELHGKYDILIMVVGSDRVNDFKTLLNKYNGVDSQHGFYKYQDIQIVSAGERDPDAEGVTGMSASKMRAAAASGDYDSFVKGLPSTFKYGEKLYKDIRTGMNVKEQLKPFKPVSEMNGIEFVREQYFQNLIFNIGDWVKDKKSEIIGEVVKRGTNYVTLVQEDFTLHKVWLEDAETMKKQNNKLPKAINFLKNRNLWEKVQRENLPSKKEAGEKEDSHKKEWGTKELTKRSKRITPGEKVTEATFKDVKDKIKKFASKFKIPTNVATAIWDKLVKAGVNPLTIQNYSVLLTTYMNLMDERIPEVAPPGSEKQILKLKKKFGADSDAPYKIAWAQYTKKKG